MRKLLLAAIAGVSSIALAPSAHAAQFLTTSGPTGTFGNDSVMCSGTTPCSFSRTFSFMTPTSFNLASATISSAIAGIADIDNIDFSSVTLKGVDFTTVATGAVEFRNLLNQALTPGGSNSLIVNGTSGGNGAFAGTLAFAAIPAVPEPAT
jgi:hypothetical protein